jgi:hypothetical protein
MFIINKILFLFFLLINNLDEYNGYSFFDAIYHGDISRVKKFLTNETINFRHFKTGDSPLVSFL